MFRSALFAKLRQLQQGRVTLVDGEGRHEFGTGGELEVTIHVRRSQFYRDVALGGLLGAGEGFIHGDWDCSDLTALVRIMVLNRGVWAGMDRGLARLAQPVRQVLHWFNRNSRKGSRRNIAAHYDLGNEFFQLFLDETMMYSCGVFEHPESSMYAASVAKNDRICRKLHLQPGDHLIEIGTGWGGFAMHAAQNYGCLVTTTTISRQQHDMAVERIAAAGLSGRVQVVMEDYRDLQGQYDKLVSIEMIEAVGHQFFDTYFKKVSHLLKPSGMALIQAITIQDQDFPTYLRTPDFIQRFVFPGGCLPSLTAICDSMSRVTDLRLFHLEDLSPHYAQTLRCWRQRFFENLHAIRELGYPETFLRLWQFYLSYCEGGFEERSVGSVQLLFTKPQCRRPSLLPALP